MKNSTLTLLRARLLEHEWRVIQTANKQNFAWDLVKLKQQVIGWSWGEFIIHSIEKSRGLLYNTPHLKKTFEVKNLTHRNAEQDEKLYPCPNYYTRVCRIINLPVYTVSY